MATYSTVRVTEVKHWSDRLFSFRTTRDQAFRFENGQFVMIGLQLGERRVVRAYSIASANHEDWLEFYSIKVPGGPLTSRLQHLRPDDELLVSNKPTGTLVLRDLRPGRRLILLATGTGLAPFMGLVRDPEVYERFEQVVLIRGGRGISDLLYGDATLRALRAHDDLGELVTAGLLDHPSVTREPHEHRARVTELVESGRAFADLGIAPLSPDSDRVMVCGSMRMIEDARHLLDRRGFVLSPGVGEPGDYVIERAFVDGAVAAPARAEPRFDAAITEAVRLAGTPLGVM